MMAQVTRSRERKAIQGVISMPMRLEITHITKPDRQDPYTRILWAGNLDGPLSNGFRDSPANIARCIKAGTHEFFVRAGTGLLGRQIEVPVLAMDSFLLGGEPFIQTARDFTTVDNLLALPEFPWGYVGVALPVPGMFGGVNRLAQVLGDRGY